VILATLCYIQRDRHTLMIHRVKRADDIHAGKWNGLGGKFESGESPEECICREVYEESGLEIKDPRLCGILVFTSFRGDDWYVFVFSAREFSGELKENGEGYLQWIPDDELEALSLWSSDHIFLSRVRQGRFFSAKFVYQGDKIKEHSVTFHP
jgi:8-oxo-dGTP diphosphatase